MIKNEKEDMQLLIGKYGHMSKMSTQRSILILIAWFTIKRDKIIKPK